MSHNVYVLVGNDTELIDSTAYSIVALTRTRSESVSDVSAIVSRLYQKSLYDEPVTFVVRYDLAFLKASESDWKKIVENKSDNILIFIYQTLDKRGKFYKFFKEYIIECNKEDENQSFMFVDNFCLHKLSNVIECAKQIKDEDALGTFSLLYSRVRTILQIQDTPKNVNIIENTGLTNGVIFYNKKFVGIYDTSSLVNILTWIDVLTRKIKVGALEGKQALLFLVVMVF